MHLLPAREDTFRIPQTQETARARRGLVRGDHTVFDQEHSLEIRVREKTWGGFGPILQARFDVATAEQVVEAAELLWQVSCPVSHVKSRRGRPVHGTAPAPSTVIVMGLGSATEAPVAPCK